MAYKQKNYFEFRDSLAKGDPDKVIKGKHFDEEFGAIEKAFGEVKVDVNAEDVIGLDTLLKDKADQSALEQEIQDRIEADKLLQSQINDFEPYDDGPIREELGDLDDKIDKEIGDRGDADDALGQRIDNLTTDDLADVNSANASRDDFLIHNGTQWVAKEFYIETELTYMGGISVVSDPAPTANNGDLYINNEEGEVGSSWTGIDGEQINEAVAVGWSEKNGRWYMLGNIATASVKSIEAGLGIDVDNDSKPSEPVVSIDRTETDKWYAPIDSVIDDGEVDGEVLTWNKAGDDWTPDDTLIVKDGNATFSGNVSASGLVYANRFVSNSSAGIFGGVGTSKAPYLLPINGSGSLESGTISLGRPENDGPEGLWKDAHFSGTVNAGNATFSGNVGIGMTPAMRLKAWKESFDARMKAEPKANKKAVTLEITDNAFEVLPTEAKLAEWIESRAAGDALQVNGNGSFSGTVSATSVSLGSGKSIYSNRCGLFFGNNSAVDTVYPANNEGNTTDNTVNLGSSGVRFKDAHFSGKLNATTINGKVTDVADHIKAITPTQIANWDAGTGNGEGGGATIDQRITDDQIIHWDQAWGWGDHNGKYQPIGDYADADFVPSGTRSGDTLQWQQGNGWVISQKFSVDDLANATDFATKSFDVRGDGSGSQATFHIDTQVNGNLTASSIKKHGGTADQLLCADGSVASRNQIVTQAEYDGLTPDADTVYFIV